MEVLTNPVAAAAWLRQQAPHGQLVADSRSIAPGDAFLAWPGSAKDARHFVADALTRGARACLVEHTASQAFEFKSPLVASYQGLRADSGAIADVFFEHPSRDLTVAAVTGTNGKTSSALWLAQALCSLPGNLSRSSAVIGTLGAGAVAALGAQRLELPPLVPTGFTTPDPVFLQRTLRDFVSKGLRFCVMEASSIGLEEHRLDATCIKVALFTNLTQDHLDYHGNMQAYWQSKARLFSWPSLEHAIVNIDDPYGANLADHLQTQDLDVWTTSIHKPARIQAREVGYGLYGLQFEVHESTQSCHLQTQMIGTFNVSNLLGVIAAMRSLGVPLTDAVAVCAQLQPVPGRMECISEPNAPLLAVDYAHTPDALGQVLDALRPLANQRKGKLLCVFGCGGDRDNTKRPMMGALAAQKADQVIVTSDNPRSEKPEAIIAQILLGAQQSRAGQVQVQADRARAIYEAVAAASASDVILLAGKGHETTQEVGGVKLPFSDRAHALEALQARKATHGGASL